MKNNEEIELREIQSIQLDILEELDRVCKQNGLNYYLACGTCIGAVRHRGFIPWDDDIDVYMYVDDIKKLISCQAQFTDRYFVQCKRTDKNFESPIVRLRDSNTACFEKDEIGLDINHGFFVDIYPLYGYPKSRIAASLNCISSYAYRILYAGRPPYNHGRFLEMAGKAVLFFFRGRVRETVIASIEKRLQSYRDADELVTYYGLDIHLTKALAYKREWFQEPSVMDFEGKEFCGPTNPDEYLKKNMEII